MSSPLGSCCQFSAPGLQEPVEDIEFLGSKATSEPVFPQHFSLSSSHSLEVCLETLSSAQVEPSQVSPSSDLESLALMRAYSYSIKSSFKGRCLIKGLETLQVKSVLQEDGN